MNSGEETGKIIMITMSVFVISLTIGSGILAWQIIHPDNFMSGAGLVLAWAIFARIGISLGIIFAQVGIAGIGSSEL
jgi:hypothetical protein